MEFDPTLPNPNDYRYPEGHGIDLVALRTKRLQRLQALMKENDLGGCLLFDPLNIRYATDTSNMQVWILHNMARYLFVPPEGGCVLFDFHNCEHLSNGLETVKEVRHTHGLFYFSGGEDVPANATRFAAEIDELLRAHSGDNRRLGVDAGNPPVWHALSKQGIDLHDGMRVAELAREIKLPEEVAAMKLSVQTCEAAMAEMEEALVPGITESKLWSHLHAGNIARGGEWIETRLLTSGPRTNPWFQEASLRPIDEGDMVSYDTDMIGPFGYCSDLSRSLVCGGKASGEQRMLHSIAREQIEYNIALVTPGMSFREFADRSYVLPDRYMKNRYSAVAHGVGLADEYPHIGYPIDAEGVNREDTLKPGMAICIESLVGDEHGTESVKLEQQVLVTETGVELLSSYPFNKELGG
ncbi:MAG: Xaa-Pro peptidase family protein [Alphaproteobacteria bacterium]|nr:Xaa-Pro peptidase family protein [Alphaproteobacteria bacterium]